MKHKSFPLILILFIYFTFLGGSLYTFTSFPLKVFNQVLVTLILGIWLWRKLRHKSPLPKTPLDWPIAFWFGVQVISAAFSVYPRFSFESLWQPITHALAFYLLVDLLPRYRGDLAKALYLSATVVCLIGLIEYASWYFGLPLLPQFVQSWPDIGGWGNPIPPYLYRLSFTLNGATFLAAYLALLIPPALALRLTTRAKDDRQALTIWLVLAVAVEVLAFSRAGIIALAISVPICVVVWFLLKAPDIPLATRLRQIPKSFIIGGVGLVAVLGLLGVVVFGQRATTTLSGDQVRLNMWQSAIRITADHPILGIGPKLFGLAVRSYRDPQYARDQITHAHNVYLNTAAETGVLGLLAGGWLAGATMLAAWRNWQMAQSRHRRLRLAGVAAALVGFGVQSMFDTFYATQIMLPLILGVAYLVSPREGFRQTMSALHLRWRPLAMLAILALYVFFLARWDLAQWHFQRASRLAQNDNFGGALAAIERATTMDPRLTLYRFEIAYYQSRLAEQEPAYLAQAIDTYRAALQSENSNPAYHANLAGLLREAGDLSGAINSLETAIALTANEPIFLLNLGYLYETQGDEAAAMTHYAAAVTALPEFLDSGFWGPTRRSRLAETIRQQTSDPLLLSRLALINNEPEEAEAWARQAIETESSQPDGYLALADAMLAQNRPVEALKILNEQTPPYTGVPQQGYAYRLQGRAKYLLGEETSAVRDLKTALFFSPFSNAQAYFTLGQIYEGQGHDEAAKQAYSRAIPPKIIPQNYDVVVYGRGARHPILIPQLLDPGQGESDAEPWLVLLRLYRATGEIDKAERVLEQLQLRFPYLSNLPAAQ